MSRVEEDREAARATALAEEKRRNEEVSRKKQNDNRQAFGRLVTAQTLQNKEQAREAKVKSAIEHLLEEIDHHERSFDKRTTTDARNLHDEKQSKAKLGEGEQQKSTTQKQSQTESKCDTRQVATSQTQSRQEQSAQTGGRTVDRQAGIQSESGRTADAKAGHDGLEAKKAADDESSDKASGLRKTSDAGGIKTDADQGGGQQKKGDGESKDGRGAEQQFRFNPALMAPPPLAQKRGEFGSDRLRRVAAELAQKIVERVRVGTNQLGNAEFQIDLRSDVLSGLSVKVSSQQGKIRAVFSGSDRQVLKMLEDHKEALQNALEARGLRLEELKIEGRS